MRALLLPNIATFLICAACTSDALALDVYIVAGQSNGYRISSLRAGDTPIPGERKIYYYGMECVSEPEESQFTVLTSLDERAMGTALALSLVKLSDDDIVFVQYCRCGSGVWNKTDKGWYPGDDPQHGKTFEDGLYGKFRKYLAHAEKMAKAEYGLRWNVKGLFWHQGESDSNGDNLLSYEKNLTNLFWRFRHDIDEHLPIVAGQIRELDDGDRAINRILAKIAEQDDMTALAKGADLQFAADRDGRPDVHYALEGCRELGRRMAAAYSRLVSEAK